MPPASCWSAANCSGNARRTTSNRLHQYRQVGDSLNKLLDAGLELHRSDHAHLEAEVTQSPSFQALVLENANDDISGHSRREFSVRVIGGSARAFAYPTITTTLAPSVSRSKAEVRHRSWPQNLAAADRSKSVRRSCSTS